MNLSLDKTHLQNFTLVWLDVNVNDSFNINTQMILKGLTDQFHIFENCDECELFLQSHNERIVFIVSGRLGREIVPRIHSIKQISIIYVYCLNYEQNKRWANNYSKIQRVIITCNELIEQIIKDNQIRIIPANNKPLYIKINQSFIDSQLLIHYLLHMKNSIIDDTQLFTSDEKNNLNKFQEIDSSDNKLEYLIKDRSPFDLITQALDEKNIDLLYLTRIYIQDIYQQLDAHKSTELIHVYHSHLVTMEEIDQLKNSIGKLISINQFFSGIFERNQALQAFEQTNDFQKILFEIHADSTRQDVKPFADIKSINSSMNNSSQIIFMLASIFHIDNFFQENDIWICQITLTNDDNLFEEIKRENGHEQIDLISFGNILGRIKEYDHGEKYCQRLLTNLSLNHLQRSIIYRNLGNIAYMKKDYIHCIEYHMQALELRKNSLEDDDFYIADSYNCLGSVYFDQKNYQQAIEYYENTLKILEKYSDKNHQKIIIILSNIAHIYCCEENYGKALDYYEKLADFQRRYLTKNHFELGYTHHNIGACFWCIGNFDQAIKSYNLSLEIKGKYLSTNDHSIAMTLENIGLIHENNDERQNAYEYYLKAANIYYQILPKNHADIEQVTENILRISTDSN